MLVEPMAFAWKKNVSTGHGWPGPPMYFATGRPFRLKYVFPQSFHGTGMKSLISEPSG